MPKPLRKPKLSRSTFAKTSFNWSRFFGHSYCFICACALIFIAPQEKINQQQVGIDQNNTAIELSVGEMLQIEHPGAGNTKKGVEWRLDELDETIWDLTEAYNQSLKKDNPGFTEGPNLEHSTFKAVQTGSSTVRIPTYQPWENKDMVEKDFSIKTIVKF